MDEADALDALSGVLEQLTANPYDINLHAQNVRLAEATGMEDQVEAALDMVTSFWAAGDHVWLRLIEHRMRSVDLERGEGLQAILDVFERAEEDYLSIPILEKHLGFLIERHALLTTSESKPQDLGELFTTGWTRSAISEVAEKGIGHLTQSHILWDMRRDWELTMLQEAADSEKAALVGHVEAMFLDRLKQPHSNHEETFQAYSTFTTSYKPPDQYESLLVQASKSRSQAVKAYERRETNEGSLSQANYSLPGYAYYIASERRAKNPDLFILRFLYERAIAEADRRRWQGEAGAEDALRSFWTGYVDTLRILDADEDLQLRTFKRAVKSIPGSGEIRARYMRFLERTENEDIEVAEIYNSVSRIYEDALTVKPVVSDAEQLVPLVLARAGYEKRHLQDEESGADFDRLLTVLMEGIARVRKASGDPRLRLEKYFSAMCLELAEEPAQAVVMWEDAAKHYKTSYLAWMSYTEVLIRGNMYEDARKVFKDICMKNLDWPEAIWEAWLQFEQTHGSVTDIEACLDRIERAQIQINARRAKDAEKAAYEAMQIGAEQQASSVAHAAPVGPAGEDVAMDVDGVPVKGGGVKRKAEDEVEPEGSKKARTEEKPPPLKRDRENCTVFVAELPSGTSEDALRALFKDCGGIREVKLTQLPNSLVATVEFLERDSVPAALTKDKKRILEQEIAVHLAWKSTLYVTNFPENADDAFIRELFGKYGVIFDVRWPSKKFKSTRRFCYVQYTSPASAEAALELHGRELEPGLPMSVLISQPERKKERTDSDVANKELYVAGLSKFVTKEDLEKLFRTYGALKDVRLALDNAGHSKGFAFVEFEQEQDAAAALAANNYELKKRRIAVTLADTRVKAKNRGPDQRAEVRNRSLRIRNLPAATQEGLLQQFIEKRVRVKRVEVFLDKNEAVVELENAAEAGKLLLHPEPLIFDGNTLQLSEETLSGASRPAGPPTATGGMFIPRSAVSRPRAGLGSKKPRTGLANGSAVASSSTAQSNTKGQDDFRKMLGGSAR